MTEIIKSSNFSDDILQQSFEKNFARLEIYYEALNFEKISESAAYDFASLVSDFGGSIGLWLGWSLFAVFELLQFLYCCLEALFRSRNP